MPKNQFIAVVGFSRSGTSLISRILAEVLGIDFGEAIEHIPKNAENPDGFYENQQIMDFNESVLHRNHASVINLPPVDFLQHLALGELNALTIQAKNLLTVAANQRPAFGFKDPRLCLTLPIWRLAAPTLKTVIIVRSPWAALQSFSAQMQRPLQELEPLWFEYQHRILLNTAGGNRFMLSFERLLSHPLETVTALAKYLGLSQNPDNKWESQLASIIKPGRVANLKPAEPFEFSPNFQPKTKLAYATLNTYLAAGSQPDYAAIGALFQGLRGYDTAHIQPLSQRIAELDSQLQQQIGYVVARDTALTEHAVMIRERDARVAALDSQLQEHSALLATHIAMVSERDVRIAALDSQLHEHSGKLAAHIGMVSERDARIALLNSQMQLGAQSQTATEKAVRELTQLQHDTTAKLLASEAAISTRRQETETLLAHAQGQLTIASQNLVASAADASKFQTRADALQGELTASIQDRHHLAREVIALATTVDELKAEAREFIKDKAEVLALQQCTTQLANTRWQTQLEQAQSAQLATRSVLEAQFTAAQTVLQAQLSAAHVQLTAAQTQLHATQALLTVQSKLHEATTDVARKKASQLNAQSRTKLRRLKQLISPPDDMWDLVAPTYSPFKTEAQTKMARQRGFGLFLAEPLRANDALVYALTPQSGGISEIQFVLDDDVRVGGELHLELLSPQHALLAHSIVMLNAVSNDGIACFTFPAINLNADAGAHFTLRLFSKDALDPVRLYEMQQRNRLSQNVTARSGFVCTNLVG